MSWKASALDIQHYIEGIESTEISIGTTHDTIEAAQIACQTNSDPGPGRYEEPTVLEWRSNGRIALKAGDPAIGSPGSYWVTVYIVEEQEDDDLHRERAPGARDRR